MASWHKILITKDKSVIIDKEDINLVSRYKWHYDQRYAKATYYEGKIKKYIYLHRLVMNFPKNKSIDHIDGNPLNCQKYNLRICNQGGNAKNMKVHKDTRSGIKGAYLTPRKGFNKWRSQIYCSGKLYYLGLYLTPEEAGVAYDKAAKKYFGEYARLNFKEDYGVVA